MSGRPGDPDDHPRLYRPQMTTFWWARRRSYLLFILRELSSVFVAWTVVYVLLLVRAVSSGEEAYQRFLDRASAPWTLLLNVVALCFVTLHAVTWFNLAPKAMVVRVRGRRVPASLVAGANYLGWAVVSVAAAWLLLSG